MTVKLEKIKIGSRGSPLALTQTKMVCAALEKAHPGLKTKIVIIKTSGDWAPSDGEVRLNSLEGGKAQFATEIEDALLKNEIEAAVHSMKDMETYLPKGLVINHMMPREDARDVMLVNRDKYPDLTSIHDIPQGAKIGTASVRRQAFLLRHNPNLEVVPLRGNVQTRIDKLRAGQIDITFLAYAGLKRLGLEHEADIIIEPQDMIPAASQGAVGIEIKESNSDILAIFDPLNCMQTLLRIKCERAVLAALNGSCHTPIGAYATLNNQGQMHIRAQLTSLDGAQSFFEEERGSVSTTKEAQSLGQTVGQRLVLRRDG